jgi:hypothetical protein
VRRGSCRHHDPGAGATPPDAAGENFTATVVTVSLVAGVGGTWTVVDVGHSGAKAMCNDVGAEDDG